MRHYLYPGFPEKLSTIDEIKINLLSMSKSKTKKNP